MRISSVFIFSVKKKSYLTSVTKQAKTAFSHATVSFPGSILQVNLDKISFSFTAFTQVFKLGMDMDSADNTDDDG